MILLLGFIIFIWIVINIFAINENLDYYKDWFNSLKDCNILELILIFTLFLPTTIIMGLIYVLLIKPFDRKENQIMTNEEFEIAFKQAIANVEDVSNMTLYNPKNPTIYVTKEHYEMIKIDKENKRCIRE